MNRRLTSALAGGALAAALAFSGSASAVDLEQLNAERVRGEELQRQNVELAGRCGYLQARLEAAEKQVLALTAPPEPDRSHAPWWKRILGSSPAA